MNCYERMQIQLKSVGLYQLDGATLVEAEMKAYADVLESLFRETENLLVDCFLDAVESPKGEVFENLFGLPATKFPLTEEKRAEREYKIELMKKRLKIKNCDFNQDAILEQLKTGGLNVSLQEDFTNRKIKVTVLEDRGYCETDEDKVAFIKQILPCHSEVEIHLLDE